MLRKRFISSIVFLSLILLTFFIPLKSNAKNLASENDFSFYSTDEQVSVQKSGGEEPEDEDWYDISHRSIIPSLPHSVDYSSMPELLTYLKTGDIVYERNGSIVGDIVGHIAMVVDIVYDEHFDQYYVLLIEASSEGVTYGLLTPTRFTEKEVIIYRVTNATEVQKQNAVNWALQEFNKKYFVDVSKDATHDNTNWYCSELI